MCAKKRNKETVLHMIIPVGEGTFLKDIEGRPESNKKERAPW